MDKSFPVAIGVAGSGEMNRKKNHIKQKRQGDERSKNANIIQKSIRRQKI